MGHFLVDVKLGMAGRDGGEADLDKLKDEKGFANVVVPDFHFRSATPIIQIKKYCIRTASQIPGPPATLQNYIATLVQYNTTAPSEYKNEKSPRVFLDLSCLATLCGQPYRRRYYRIQRAH